jgi:prepilin-type N-terminal cleavage/methylation domain-containing protein
MIRPIPMRLRSASHGFTLIEILVATTLSLLLLAVVITMFGQVSESITDSRSMLEAADRLRLVEERLQLDLAGATVTANPGANPAGAEGYLEYIEGPIGTVAPMTLPWTIAKNTDSGNVDDKTVGDYDDMLLLTTRSSGRPFVGKYNGNNTIQSDVAEVAWFLRGHTLHRRVLLVVPSAVTAASATGFYANNDISVHPNSGTTVAANTLADLARRECRFAHTPLTTTPQGSPYSSTAWGQLGLPTMLESSHASYNIANPPISSYPGNKTRIDFWSNRTSNLATDDYPWGDDVLYPLTTNSRVSDDIILTHVIGFDVKAWDSTANGGQGGYVDLGGGNGNWLGGYGDTGSQLAVAGGNGPRVYDTWSASYYGAAASNGLDDNAAGQPGYGLVDDDTERTYPPPYPIPLRGIQVKIRIYEPDSKQIREVTVKQDFLPQ